MGSIAAEVQVLTVLQYEQILDDVPSEEEPYVEQHELSNVAPLQGSFDLRFTEPTIEEEFCTSTFHSTFNIYILSTCSSLISDLLMWGEEFRTVPPWLKVLLVGADFLIIVFRVWMLGMSNRQRAARLGLRALVSPSIVGYWLCFFMIDRDPNKVWVIPNVLMEERYLILKCLFESALH
jgi:hypothetical protein